MHSRNSNLLRICSLLGFLVLPAIYLLKGGSFWYDEVFSGSVVSESLPGMWQHWFPYDAHPPLYYLLLWGWVRLVPFSEPTWRLLSFLFFVIGLAGYYFNTKHWNNWSYMAGLLLCATPLVQYYSIELRCYSLGFMLSLIFFTRYHRLGTLDATGYLLLGLISLSHFFGFVLAASLLAVHTLWHWRYHFWQHFAKAFLVLLPAIAFFAWLVFFGELFRFTGGNFTLHSSFLDAMRFIVHSLVPGAGILGDKYLAISIVFVVILNVALFYTIDVRKLLATSASRIMMIALVLGLSILLLLNLWTPLFTPRYLIVFLPVAALLIAANISPGRLHSRMASTSLSMLLLLGFVLLTLKSNHRLADRSAPMHGLHEQADTLATYSLPVYSLHNDFVRDLFTDHMNAAVSNFYRAKLHPERARYTLIRKEQLPGLHPPFIIQTVFVEATTDSVYRGLLPNLHFRTLIFKSTSGNERCYIVTK